jgi:hypothetical protein
MDHIEDKGRHDAKAVRLLKDILLAPPRLCGLRGLALLYCDAPLGPAQGDVPDVGGDRRPRGRRRRFPAHVAGRWAVTWGASLALFATVRTVGRAPFVGLLRWITAAAPALPTHPTNGQTLAALPVTLGLFILTLAALAVLAGPVLVPLIAAGHIVVSWLWGGER